MTPAEDAAPATSPSYSAAGTGARAGARVRTDREIDQDIPYGVRIAAAWAWRGGLILLVIGLLVWLLSHVSFLIIPVMVAALLSGLLSPAVRWMANRRVPKGLAVAITVLGFIGLIVGALTLVGRQLMQGFGELWSQALTGVQQVQTWLSEGPLHLTAAQIDKYIEDATAALQNNSSSILSGALTFGSTAGHFAAGLVLALFILIFFLLEGDRIWAFLVRLMPRKARRATDGAGRRGWTSMVSYARIQMFVAFVDAVGIGVGAAIIGVPLALPLGVLVFLGSFIPVVGALFTGADRRAAGAGRQRARQRPHHAGDRARRPAARKPHPAAPRHGQGRLPPPRRRDPVRRGRLLPRRDPRRIVLRSDPCRSKLVDSLHCGQNVGT